MDVINKGINKINVYRLSQEDDKFKIILEYIFPPQAEEPLSFDSY